MSSVSVIDFTSKVCLYECKCQYILILFTSKVCLYECKCGYILIYLPLKYVCMSVSVDRY